MSPTSHHFRTTLIAASTILTAAVMLLLAPAAQAADASDPAAANTLTALTNRDRTDAGLAPLTVASDLVAVAVQHSREMAAQGNIYHNTNLAQQGGSWQVIAEN